MPDSSAINITVSIPDSFLMEIKEILLSQKKGEFYWGLEESTWTHFILPILIPIVFSILAFSLARMINILTEKKKTLKLLKEKEDYLFTWIELISDNISLQVKAYRRFSEELVNPNMVKLDQAYLHIDKLKLIDSITLVSLFITNKKGNSENKNQLLFKLENIIGVIDRIDKKSKENVENLQTYLKENTKKWNEEYRKAGMIIAQLHGQYTKMGNPAEVYKILEVYAAYTRTGPAGMHGCMKQFVDKAAPISNTYFNLHPNDILISNLLDIFTHLRLTNTDYHKCIAYYQEYYQNSAKQTENNYRKLKDLKDALKKLEFKRLWQIK